MAAAPPQSAGPRTNQQVKQQPRQNSPKSGVTGAAYPQYQQYPGYPTYPQYPTSYPQYPAYPGYQQYPGYPAYPQYQYPQYPGYPYHVPTYGTYQQPAATPQAPPPKSNLTTALETITALAGATAAVAPIFTGNQPTTQYNAPSKSKGPIIEELPTEK